MPEERHFFRYLVQFQLTNISIFHTDRIGKQMFVSINRLFRGGNYLFCVVSSISGIMDLLRDPSGDILRLPGDR